MYGFFQSLYPIALGMQITAFIFNLLFTIFLIFAVIGMISTIRFFIRKHIERKTKHK